MVKRWGSFQSAGQQGTTVLEPEASKELGSVNRHLSKPENTPFLHWCHVMAASHRGDDLKIQFSSTQIPNSDTVRWKIAAMFQGNLLHSNNYWAVRQAMMHFLFFYAKMSQDFSTNPIILIATRWFISEYWDVITGSQTPTLEAGFFGTSSFCPENLLRLIFSYFIWDGL